MNDFLTEMNGSNSNLDKQKIILKYSTNEYIKKVLLYTYNPVLQFGVTSKNVLKFSKKSTDVPDTDMFDLLDSLSDRKLTGNMALNAVFQHSLTEPVILKIIDKNLKIRVNVASINKAIPGLIPVFQPVLSNEYTEKTKLDSNWYISRKLDGVRCLILVTSEKITPMSRTGKVLHNLDTIKDALSGYKGKDVFLDGELVHFKNDTEDFANTVSIVRSSKSEIDASKLVYKVFDIIPKETFFMHGKNTETFSKRQKKLCKFVSKLQGNVIQIVKQVMYTRDSFASMSQAVSDMSWEGLMVRKDSEYKGKRNNDLLKIKKFKDSEFKVTGITSGTIRMISEKTGLDESVECMSAALFKNKEIQVKVGSGFTMKQRRDYFKNPELIIGKMITVKYFEETSDGSLRFPIFIEIRDYE
jgi:DNA ligase-1